MFNMTALIKLINTNNDVTIQHQEMNDFINANQGLMSRVGNEIEFPDFSNDELRNIILDRSSSFNFTWNFLNN